MRPVDETSNQTPAVLHTGIENGLPANRAWMIMVWAAEGDRYMGIWPGLVI